jgi:hypothetical protein
MENLVDMKPAFKARVQGQLITGSSVATFDGRNIAEFIGGKVV